MISVGSSAGSLATPATAASDDMQFECMSSSAGFDPIQYKFGSVSTTPFSTSSPSTDPNRFESEANSTWNKKQVLEFNVEKTNLLAESKQWEELADYLDKFVASYHANEFGPSHSHPGLLFAVYQAQILYHIEDNELDEAKKLLHEKVEPLLNQDANSLYRPIDLEDRIRKLRLCVSESVLLRDDELDVAKDVQMCVNDYISLYFAASNRKQQFKRPSMNDFACVAEETAGDQVIRRYRCLACHWVMPKGQSITSLGYHLKHTKDKRCPSVTIHLLRRLHEIEGVDEPIPDMKALLSLLQNPKKRKSVSGNTSASGRSCGIRLLGPQVPMMDTISVMSLVLKLGTMETLCSLQSVSGSVHSTVSVVTLIVRRQESLVAKLREMVADAAAEVPARLLKASVVLAIFEYLPCLPGHIRGQIVTLETHLSELRNRCFSAQCGYREVPPPAKNI